MDTSGRSGSSLLAGGVTVPAPHEDPLLGDCFTVGDSESPLGV